jgi:hypothetical protein
MICVVTVRFSPVVSEFPSCPSLSNYRFLIPPSICPRSPGSSRPSPILSFPQLKLFAPRICASRALVLKRLSSMNPHFTRIFRLFPQLKLFAPRIRASWALVLKRVSWDVLGRRLYETIFEEAPFLESMFDRSAITMGIKLVDMIDSMVGAPGRPWRG